MQHQNFQVSVLNLFQMLEFFHKKKLLFTFMDILDKEMNMNKDYPKLHTRKLYSFL